MIDLNIPYRASARPFSLHIGQIHEKERQDPRSNPLTLDGRYLKSVVDSEPVYLPLDYVNIHAVESLPNRVLSIQSIWNQVQGIGSVKIIGVERSNADNVPSLKVGHTSTPVSPARSAGNPSVPSG